MVDWIILFRVVNHMPTIEHELPLILNWKHECVKYWTEKVFSFLHSFCLISPLMWLNSLFGWWPVAKVNKPFKKKTCHFWFRSRVLGCLTDLLPNWQRCLAGSILCLGQSTYSDFWKPKKFNLRFLWIYDTETHFPSLVFDRKRLTIKRAIESFAFKVHLVC